MRVSSPITRPLPAPQATPTTAPHEPPSSRYGSFPNPPPSRQAPPSPRAMLARLCLAIAAVVGLSSTQTFSLSCDGDSPTTAPPPPAKLPIFYFHGTNGNAANSANYRANLTAEGRSIVALDFCSDACSSTNGLNRQIALGVAQVRAIVAANPALYENGYIFMGHSQGGTLAKFVIQEMDDHKVRTFISLAASANGRFYGPQPEDLRAAVYVAQLVGPQVPPAILNVSAYAADPALMRGKFQRDFLAAVFANPALQATIPQFNQARSPYVAPWVQINTVIPVYNNLVDCAGDATCRANQKRYRDNFLRVNNIHLFASPNDTVQAPYQTGLYGFYSSVDTLDEVETKFQELQVLDMTETKEYVEDLYGLKTLNEAGRLHRHLVPNVDHNCWNRDSTDFGWACAWKPIYEQHIYPLL